MNLQTLTAATAAAVALSLSDGTPVEFVKITSKDRIQVRVPTSHPLGADDPLRIFNRDGTHYKGRTDLTLVATSAAGSSAASAPAAAPASSNDNTVYTVGDADFDSFEDAKNEAIDLYDGENNVEIVATTRKVVGVVGFTRLAA